MASNVKHCVYDRIDNLRVLIMHPIGMVLLKQQKQAKKQKKNTQRKKERHKQTIRTEWEREREEYEKKANKNSKALHQKVERKKFVNRYLIRGDNPVLCNVMLWYRTRRPSSPFCVLVKFEKKRTIKTTQ